jgi:hypothetical protein
MLARVTANLKMAKLRRGFEERIESDLRAMTLLRELGAQCARGDADPDRCLQQILGAAIALAGAEKGHLQLFDRIRLQFARGGLSCEIDMLLREADLA